MASAASPPAAAGQGAKAECAICLQTYDLGDSVKTLPCLHQFHCACIDPWLRNNAICPVCKFPAVIREDQQLAMVV